MEIRGFLLINKMNLNIVSSSYTARTGLKPVANEPSILPIEPQKPRGLILIPTELTPLPEIEVLKTNTEMLMEITTHPDGVRINKTVFKDPDYLKKQYLKVFRAFLDRAEKTPDRSAELISQGLDYVLKRDKQLAKQLVEDTKFVETRKKSLEEEKEETTKGVSVKDRIALAEGKVPPLEEPVRRGSPLSQEQLDLNFRPLTKKQIQELLREQGTPFTTRTKKADLIKLLNK